MWRTQPNGFSDTFCTEIPSSSDSDDDSDIELLDPEIVIKEEEEVYPVPYVPTTSNIFSVQEPTGLPTSSSCSDPPEPIVRDFINHPFDGPKGFYVPHPPLEARASLQRILWMRAENAARCTQAGLPYKFQVGRIQYGQSGSGGHKHISGLSMGGMKRKQEELEDLDRSGHLKNKRRLLIEDHESEPDLGYGTTFLDIRNGRFLSKSEFTKRQGRDKREGKGKGKESAPGLRSILKPTAPVKTLSWKRRAWPSIPETPLSPKMGPEKMAIRMKEPNAVYNSVRDHRLDKKWIGTFRPIKPDAVTAALVSDPLLPPRDLAAELLSTHSTNFGQLQRDDWTDFRSEPNSQTFVRAGRPRLTQEETLALLLKCTLSRRPPSLSDPAPQQ